MNKIIKICVILIVLLIYSSESGARIVAVGDLPEDYDPSLVLRKGRTIRIVFECNINSKTLFGGASSRIINNIYDDTGQILLLPNNQFIFCLYRISDEQNKIKINISAMEMILYPEPDSDSIMFFNPPRFRTAVERASPPIPPFLPGAKQKNMEMRQRSIEVISQVRDQIFVSPTMSAELVFDVESDDLASESGKITLGENASGDRTIDVKMGYQVDLQVHKDILFSGPFIGHRTGYAGFPLYWYWMPPP